MTATPCWRICEVSPNNKMLTLLFPWRNSRHLPMATTLKAEPFTKVYNGRDRVFVGFHVYKEEEHAQAFLSRLGTDRRFAMLYCEGTGLQPAKSEPGVYLANELKLISVVARNY